MNELESVSSTLPLILVVTLLFYAANLTNLEFIFPYLVLGQSMSTFTLFSSVHFLTSSLPVFLLPFFLLCSPSPSPIPFSFKCHLHFLHSLPSCSPPPLSLYGSISVSPPPARVQPSGHQSHVVSESPEVHSLLHLAQLPLADSQDPRPGAAAANAGRLPLLSARLPGQEDDRGLSHG